MAINSQPKTTVSEYIVEQLINSGVNHVFGYTGANITYLIDAISSYDGIEYVQAYHEQGAAFAANGYAQAAGTLGVAIASSGPGALNLVTGIANAYCDSIATLYICGDLSRRYQKNTLPLRQDGFQSIDIVSVVEPITKFAEVVRSPDDIRYCIERAIYEASSGRRGPALLSIPHWIQHAEIDPTVLSPFVVSPLKSASLDEFISEEILETLSRSRRPLILLGGGGANSETDVAMKRFLGCNPLPAVASLCGLNVLSHEHQSYVGFIGDYGHRHANIALAASDCLIVLGSRMDERQFGFLKDYRENKSIIHVDIDRSEFLPKSERYFPVLGLVSDFLNRLCNVSLEFPSLVEWNRELHHLKEHYPVHTTVDCLSPASFLLELFIQLAPDTQAFVDVGLHQMCTAQFGMLTHGKKLYFSGGLGSMGYSLPAAIGGHLARLGRQTICITGDGGLMMSLPELQTLARDRLDVKIIVFNNQCLGMVRNHQQAMLDGRTFGSVDGYLAGDFKKISSAFDIKYCRIRDLNDLKLLDEILHTPGPSLIEVLFPHDMTPFPSSVNYPLEGDVCSLQDLTSDGDN